MSWYKRKPSQAKEIAILTFYWILELLLIFVFWTNQALTNMLNGVGKTVWLFWKKLQTELRWPLATFPIRVTPTTICWAFFFFLWEWWEWTFTPADLLFPPALYLCCSFCSARKRFLFFPSVFGVYISGKAKAIAYGAFTSLARSWHHLFVSYNECLVYCICNSICLGKTGLHF